MSSTKPRGRGQRSSWRKRRAGSRGRARGEGLGAAGKFALAEKSTLRGNFHPAHKGTRGAGENKSFSLPPGQGHLCVEKCSDPTGPPAPMAARAPRAARVGTLPEAAAVRQLPSPRDTYNAKVVKCSPNRLTPPPDKPCEGGDKGPDGNQRRQRRGVPGVREAGALLRKWCPERC